MCICVCAYTVYVCVSACVCVCKSLCVWLCMHVCDACVNMHSCIWIYAFYVGMSTCKSLHVCVYQLYACVHDACMCEHAYSCIWRYAFYVGMSICKNSNACVCMCDMCCACVHAQNLTKYCIHISPFACLTVCMQCRNIFSCRIIILQGLSQSCLWRVYLMQIVFIK